jgi:3-dehydroquinate dehydratase/shikimate dehydrogenase
MRGADKMTYLAAPIAAGDLEQAKTQIKAALQKGAQMLELRCDYLENLNPSLVEKLIAEAKRTRRPVPVIVTCRDHRQGGARQCPRQLRVNVLTAALKAGTEYIDIEYENFLDAQSQEKIKRALAESSKGRLILSAHNFESRFDDIRKLYQRIIALHPAAIPKLVYKANHINDCFDAFDLLRRTGGDRIVFCMGEAGVISRIIAKKLGAFLTFASPDEKSATAEGQLTIEQFKKLYRYDAINADTKLYGVIGSPIAHSIGSAIHNACFTKAKLNKLYMTLLVEGGKSEFEQFMNHVLGRNWLTFRGFSVTIPHKQNAIEYVRTKGGFIEPLAERIGAVNTLLADENGALSAYNTDYTGAMEAIESKLSAAELQDLPVAIVGAGGAARAIVAGLRDAGAKITIYNRTIEKGKKLASEFGCDFAPLSALQDTNAKLLANCTSVGTFPDTNETPVPKKCLKKGMAVFDVVYNPRETLLLKHAKEKKLKRIDGLSMFVNQAAAQFKFFTGKPADTKLMRKAIADCLSNK